MLYLSLYFKSHRDDYYSLLNKVRLDGDWESWLQFFAEAVEFTANAAIETTNRLTNLADANYDRIAALGRRTASLEKLHDALLNHPVATPGLLSISTGLTPATVSNGLRQLQTLGIVDEVTGRKRGRVYVYRAYLDILNEGDEPP